ncbi:MAG: aminodeoxychorismate synthase component I [Epsilonproteobacteria bacterium]|nr:aminodeoxychorismate synthase component I [Campylobacterota bacterium]
MVKFFLIDFKKSQFIIKDIDDTFLIDFDGIRNYTPKSFYKHTIFQKFPIPFEVYNEAFDKVIEQIKRGNTYLLNLTFATPIYTNLTLLEMFYRVNAKFKLQYDNFVCFSPERFVKISNNHIYTYPMKGTIDASIPNARDIIMHNQKEFAEHTMVVDLLRNDLAMVANHIKVTKFRYIDKIYAGDKELLQVSSEIVGKMPHDWIDYWQDLIWKLLPAGSVTGTPKISTVDIIENVENYERGFYTGIFGIVDEENRYLDSAVLIRFIQQENGRLYYKSGGGITLDSNVYDEYNELNQKVYI